MSDVRSPLHDISHHSHHGAMPMRRDSDLSDAFLSPEAYRATQAVEFIAEHLRNEDEYVQVRIGNDVVIAVVVVVVVIGDVVAVDVFVIVANVAVVAVAATDDIVAVVDGDVVAVAIVTAVVGERVEDILLLLLLLLNLGCLCCFCCAANGNINFPSNPHSNN